MSITMSNRQILWIAIALGFVCGFSAVSLASVNAESTMMAYTESN